MTRFVLHCLLVVLLTSGGCSEQSDTTNCEVLCDESSEGDRDTSLLNGCATVDGERPCVRFCAANTDCDLDRFPGGCAAGDDNGRKYCTD